MAVQHRDLAGGQWQRLTLAEQLGNIGSEVHRTHQAAAKKPERSERAAIRALELFDMTLADPRWRGRLREIARAREVFCDAFLGGSEYGSNFPQLEKYFDQFAVLARR